MLCRPSRIWLTPVFFGNSNELIITAKFAFNLRLAYLIYGTTLPIINHDACSV